jgi:hypothetical protein
MTALFEGDRVSIAVISGKDAPGHLHVTIGGNLNWGWGTRFGQRSTYGPTTENVPTINPGLTFEFAELIFGRLREAHPVNRRFDHG